MAAESEQKALVVMGELRDQYACMFAPSSKPTSMCSRYIRWLGNFGWTRVFVPEDLPSKLPYALVVVEEENMNDSDKEMVSELIERAKSHGRSVVRVSMRVDVVIAHGEEID